MVAYPSSSAAGLFGDGSSGAVTLDGVATVPWATLVGSTYTMTADCFCTSLTVNNAITLATSGYRVFCTGTVTNNGTIGVLAGSAAGAVGGTASAAGFMGAGSAGQNGGTGVGTSAPQPDWGAIGCGLSGGGGAGTSGAGGGGANPIFGSQGRPDALRTPWPVISGYIWSSHGAFQPVGAGGGASGAGDGAASGGGGGAGGGIVAILAHALVNNGTITAAAGNGGTPAAGNCGGGGGGGGGVVATYTLTAPTGTGSMTAAGGAAGGHTGTGANGTAGAAGLVVNVVVQ